MAETGGSADLAGELARAFARFDAAVAGFEPVVLENEAITGSWTARDLAGHLADWAWETLGAAEHILGGPKPRGQPFRSRQDFNTMQAALRGTDPWEVAAADLAAMRDRALRFAADLTPEHRRAIGPYPWGEIGTVERLLTRLVAHIDEHAAQIEEWRLRRGGKRPEE